MKWEDKPYHSLDHELKKRFGEKVYRLALDGGMTCPNRDGRVGYGGCIFCSAGGSGDFTSLSHSVQTDAASCVSSADSVPVKIRQIMPVSRQLQYQKEIIRKKSNAGKFIAYFQAFTNTYAPAEYLRSIFEEAMSDPEVCALSIATRPDCLPEPVVSLLEELNQQKPVWVELGLQTIHEQTALMIRRGYPLSVFEAAVRNLRQRGIEVIVHTIIGLPGETKKELSATLDYINNIDVQGIKLQLLHILKGTDLATLYEKQPFPVYTQEEYISLLVACVERLRPDLVIHRLTGDGPKKLLIAPLWTGNKRNVLNQIHAAFRQKDTWQGKRYPAQS